MTGPIEQTYRDFAVFAHGTSPCFEEWALGVAGDAELQAWLRNLPEPKRQPNLVFAAARWHGLRAPAPYADLRAALLGDDGAIRATILERATQTNEVGRLATLVPAFSAVADGRPVALLEAGASGGLCLYPDRWSYRWETPDGSSVTAVAEVAGVTGTAERVLTAEVTGPAPLPTHVLEVVRRGGVDLNPLDVTDPDAADWLLTLVWPEHDDRRARLAEAVEVARAEPATIRRGDLLSALSGLVEEVLADLPPEAVLVVFHSAVVAYLPDDDRTRFDSLMREMITDPRVHWVSNEGRHVLADVTATGPEPPPGRFVLGIDGRAVGHTEGHGRALHWWA